MVKEDWAVHNSTRHVSVARTMASEDATIVVLLCFDEDISVDTRAPIVSGGGLRDARYAGVGRELDREGGRRGHGFGLGRDGLGRKEGESTYRG